MKVRVSQHIELNGATTERTAEAEIDDIRFFGESDGPNPTRIQMEETLDVLWKSLPTQPSARRDDE